MQLGPVMALVSGPLVGGAVSDPDNAITTLVAVEPDDVKLVDELFMRIFNRPATEAEIESGVAMIHGIPQEHQKLVAELIEMQRSLAPKITEQNRRRQAAIAVAKGQLAAYEKEIAPRGAELDRQQQQLITQLEARLKAHEQTLPEKLAAWEKRDDRVTQWKPLDPTELSATSATTLTKQKDLSVLATSSNGLGAYKFVARTDQGPGPSPRALRHDLPRLRHRLGHARLQPPQPAPRTGQGRGGDEAVCLICVVGGVRGAPRRGGAQC